LSCGVQNDGQRRASQGTQIQAIKGKTAGDIGLTTGELNIGEFDNCGKSTSRDGGKIRKRAGAIRARGPAKVQKQTGIGCVHAGDQAVHVETSGSLGSKAKRQVQVIAGLEARSAIAKAQMGLDAKVAILVALAGRGEIEGLLLGSHFLAVLKHRVVKCILSVERAAPSERQRVATRVHDGRTAQHGSMTNIDGAGRIYNRSSVSKLHIRGVQIVGDGGKVLGDGLSLVHDIVHTTIIRVREEQLGLTIVENDPRAEEANLATQICARVRATQSEGHISGTSASTCGNTI